MRPGDLINEIPAEHVIAAIRAVFQTIGSAGEERKRERMEERKEIRRANSGKKTVRL